MRTGFTAFWYSIRTGILPFMFIFNPQLLLIGIDSWPHLVLIVAGAITAMLVFAAATQGWFIARSRWYESVALLLVTFTLLRPGFWLDMALPEIRNRAAERELTELADRGAAGRRLARADRRHDARRQGRSQDRAAAARRARATARSASREPA